MPPVLYSGLLSTHIKGAVLLSIANPILYMPTQGVEEAEYGRY
jgi:hypothetical protein